MNKFIYIHITIFLFFPLIAIFVSSTSLVISQKHLLPTLELPEEMDRLWEFLISQQCAAQRVMTRRMSSEKKHIFWENVWRFYTLEIFWVVVSPIWGRFPLLTNIFQMGWNHQLVLYEDFESPKGQVMEMDG